MLQPPPNYDGAHVLWENRTVRSESVSFGHVRYQPGGYCGPRVQRDYELVLLRSGGCEVRIDTSPHILQVGLAYLFRPGHREHFQFSNQAESHHSWCSVTPAFFPEAMRRELDAAPALGVPCSELFHRVLSGAFLSRPGAGRVIEALGLALFTEFLDLVQQAHGENRGEDAVRRALSHMEDHFSEETCLAAAHHVAGCSVNALIYKFTRQTGFTPARYLWKLRAEKGIAMLTGTGLTVAEIAYRCGFKNPFHFSRLIRQHYGESPRKLRLRAWS